MYKCWPNAAEVMNYGSSPLAESGVGIGIDHGSVDTTMSFDDGDMHKCIRTGEPIFICTRISVSLLILAFCFWKPSIKHGCPC